MADIILTAELTGNQGYDYKVEIIDTAAASPTGETFKVSDVIITYDPTTDDPTGQIVASTCDIHLLNEGGYVNSTFIPSLTQYQQDKYQVKVYRDTGSGYSLWWFGWVIQDIVEDVEQSQPRKFKLTAVDGLSILSEVEYDFANTDAAQTTPIQKILITALNANGLNGLIGTDDWLITTVDWWETQMTYGATIDPCSLAFVDVRVWNIFNEYWEREPVDCLTVLAQLCVTYGARLYQSEGAYRFEQYNERETATMREVAYQHDFTQNSTTDSATRELVIGTNTSALSARALDNVFSFLPAVKRCEINYEKLFLSRNYGQFNYDETSATTQGIGYLEVVTDIGLSIVIDYWGIASGNLANNGLVEFRFDMTLTCTTTGGTTYYYTNDDEGTWTTSVTTFLFSSVQERVPITVDYTRVSGTMTILTNELPDDGNIALTIDLESVREKPRGRSWRTVTPTRTKWTAAAQINLEDGSFNDDSEIFYSTSSNSKIGDNEILEIGKTNIGDGALQTGSIWVKASGTSGTIARSEDWRKSNSGAFERILNLGVETTQGYYHQPLKVYDGAILHSESFGYRLNFDSDFYLPTNCSFSCAQGVWSGRWWVIDLDITDITIETSLQKRRRLFTRPKANANGNDLPNGLIGGVQVTEGDGQIDGIEEYEITPALITAGITAVEIVPAQGSGKYIVPTKVLIVKTDGSIDYGSGNASLFFSSETTDVIQSAGLLTAINTGLTKQFNPTDDTKFFANEALLLTVGSDASGDWGYTLKVYYKVI